VDVCFNFANWLQPSDVINRTAIASANVDKLVLLGAILYTFFAVKDGPIHQLLQRTTDPMDLER
jgi:hypothetical protein